MTDYCYLVYNQGYSFGIAVGMITTGIIAIAVTAMYTHPWCNCKGKRW